jgi:hypothetical protein
MTRSKEDKIKFIQELRIAADAVERAGTEIPFRLLGRFSPKNCYAILSQDPNATNCAGFHEWRKAGRIVRKGSKGLAILVPMGMMADAEGTSERMRFSWRYVFDVTSTDPIAEDSPSTLGELMADA